MNPTIHHIGAALKKARQEKGITQAALAVRVGLPQSHLSKIERGLVDLRLSSLIELARTLDLDVILLPPLLIHMVKELQRPRTSTEQRPLYQLEDDHEG